MVQSANTIEKDVEQTENDIEALTYHQEIICSLNLSANKEAADYQKQIAEELAHTFEHGAKGIKSNKWKAKKYAQMAGLKTPITELPDTAWKTETVYNAFNFFNDARLFSVRLMNVLLLLKVVAHSVFNTVLSAMGLFFALRLAFDIALVFKGTFFPASQAEKDLGTWERFKAVMKKDDRMYRMANDLVWFSINFLAMCFTSGLSVAGVVITTTLMTISGFAFDTFAEMVRWREIKTLESALADIEMQKIQSKKQPELVALLDELKQQEEQRQIILGYMEFNKEEHLTDVKEENDLLATTDNAIATIKNNPIYRDYVKVVHIEEALTQKLQAAKRDRLYMIGLVALICIGTGLSLFPMTLPIGLVVLGGAVGFLSGSVFNGLGDRIAKWFKPAAKPAVIVETPNVADQPIVPNANALLQQAIATNTSEAVVVQNNVIPFRQGPGTPSHYGLYADHGNNNEPVVEEEIHLKLDIEKVAFN